MTTPGQIYNEFFSSSRKIEKNMEKDLAIILHCEFSSYRAPQTYNLIRKTDRKINEEKYPKICYPELYLLENGYKEFFEHYPVRFSPFETIISSCPSFALVHTFHKSCGLHLNMNL